MDKKKLEDKINRSKLSDEKKAQIKSDLKKKAKGSQKPFYK